MTSKFFGPTDTVNEIELSDYSKEEVNALIAEKADISDVYTKDQTDEILSSFYDKTAINAYVTALKVALVYNVQDYGAMGDGETDDTTAMQAAIDVAHAAGGGMVFWPYGTYMTTGLTLYGNITYTGTGWLSQIKLLTASTGNIFTLADYANDLTICNLYLNGDIWNNSSDFGSDVATMLGCGIAAHSTNEYVYKNVNIYNTRIFNCNKGISVAVGAGGWMMSHLHVELCKYWGVEVPTDSELSSSFIGTCGKFDSWYNCNVIITGWESRVINNHLWDSYVNVRIEYAHQVDLSHNKIEEASMQGLVIRGTCNGNNIVGNNFRENSQLGSGLYNAVEFVDNGGTAESNIIANNKFGTKDITTYHKYCIAEDSGSDNNYFIGNLYKYGYNAASPVSIVGTNTVSRQNYDLVDTNSGTATVPSGSTSITVTHGLGGIPDASNITVTPTNSLGDASKFYISNITSTTFDIYIDVDPGATTATFAWKAKV